MAAHCAAATTCSDLLTSASCCVVYYVIIKGYYGQHKLDDAAAARWRGARRSWSMKLRGDNSLIFLQIWTFFGVPPWIIEPRGVLLKSSSRPCTCSAAPLLRSVVQRRLGIIEPQLPWHKSHFQWYNANSFTLVKQTTLHSTQGWQQNLLIPDCCSVARWNVFIIGWDKA